MTNKIQTLRPGREKANPAAAWHDAPADVVQIDTLRDAFSESNADGTLEFGADIAQYVRRKARATDRVMRLISARTSGECLSQDASTTTEPVSVELGAQQSQDFVAKDGDANHDLGISTMDNENQVIHFPFEDKDIETDSLLEVFAKRYADARNQARDRITRANNRIRELTNTAQALSQEKSGLSDQLGDAKVSLAQVKAELSNAHSELGRAESDLKVAKAALEKLESDRAAAMREWESKNSQALASYEANKSSAVMRAWVVSLGISIALIGGSLLANGVFHFMHFGAY